MAENKPERTRMKKSQKPGQAEAAPNPHNETNVIEIPVRTDQSVAGGVADMDSMFNDADPQTAEARASKSATARRGEKKKKA